MTQTELDRKLIASILADDFTNFILALSIGADINTPSEDMAYGATNWINPGWPAFMLVVYYGREDMFEFLVENWRELGVMWGLKVWGDTVFSHAIKESWWLSQNPNIIAGLKKVKSEFYDKREK